MNTDRSLNNLAHDNLRTARRVSRIEAFLLVLIVLEAAHIGLELLK